MTTQASLGYVLIADMVRFSEEPPAAQAQMVDSFIAVLLEAVGETLQGVRFNIFPTGDGAIVSVYGDGPDEMRALADRPIKLARTLLERSSEHPFQLKISLNYSDYESLIDVASAQSLHAEVIQIGNGINMAERILNFADPGEIVISDSYRRALENAQLCGDMSFATQKDLFVKHHRKVDIHIYIPSAAEAKYISIPKEEYHRDYKRYAYFPPLTDSTLHRFDEIGLSRDILQTIEYVYETISAVNSGQRFISWASVYDLLASLKPLPNEQKLVVSRGDFWDSPGANRYIRTMRARGQFNEKRLFLFDVHTNTGVPFGKNIDELRQLHAAGTLLQLPLQCARGSVLARLKFGVTIFPTRGCIVVPIPPPASYDQYLSIVQSRDPWTVFDLFAVPDSPVEFKAYVIADRGLTRRLADEFDELVDHPSAESLS